MNNEINLQNVLSETQRLRDLLHIALNRIATIEAAGRQLYEHMENDQ